MTGGAFLGAAGLGEVVACAAAVGVRLLRGVMAGLTSRGGREGGKVGGPAGRGTWGERSYWGEYETLGLDFLMGVGWEVLLFLLFFSTPLAPHFSLPHFFIVP